MVAPGDDLRSMDRGVSGSDLYARQHSIQIPNPKEFQSEYKTKIAPAATPPHGPNRQVEGFMQSRQITMPPESVASMASIPMTSFEDTQQMLRAYKKKKRDLAKMKERIFKLETDFSTVKQTNALLEDELEAT